MFFKWKKTLLLKNLINKMNEKIHLILNPKSKSHFLFFYKINDFVKDNFMIMNQKN